MRRRLTRLDSSGREQTMQLGNRRARRRPTAQFGSNQTRSSCREISRTACCIGSCRTICPACTGGRTLRPRIPGQSVKQRIGSATRFLLHSCAEWRHSSPIDRPLGRGCPSAPPAPSFYRLIPGSRAGKRTVSTLRHPSYIRMSDNFTALYAQANARGK